MEINPKRFTTYENGQLNKAAKGIIESIDGLPVNEALSLLKTIVIWMQYMDPNKVINIIEEEKAMLSVKTDGVWNGTFTIVKNGTETVSHNGNHVHQNFCIEEDDAIEIKIEGVKSENFTIVIKAGPHK